MPRTAMGDVPKRRELALWLVIAAYTAIIYSTLSMVSVWRKLLVERFGYGIFDGIYWVFVLLVLLGLGRIFARLHGRHRLQATISWILLAGAYAYFLGGMRYAVERIHLLEYGFLGAGLFAAVSLRYPGPPAVAIATAAGYVIGLGDEAIQSLLPARVGEWRDGLWNGISGLMGILALVVMRHPPGASFAPVSTSAWRAALFAVSVAYASTIAFIAGVHGFGYRVVSPQSGIWHSSLSEDTRAAINAGRLMDARFLRSYRDEAVRHLFQREYYCHNEFLARDGSRYTNWRECWGEQRILETGYTAFLREHRAQTVETFLREYDKQLARQVKGNRVAWSDSLRRTRKALAGAPGPLYRSRVAATIITGFKPRDLVFYSLAYGLFAGWLWWRLSE